MKNLFLFSTFSSSHFLLQFEDYVFNKKIENILLLEETVPHLLCDANISRRITIFQSLEECINHSDCILIVDGCNLPQDKVNGVNEMAVKSSKNVFTLTFDEIKDIVDIAPDYENNDSIQLLIFSLGINPEVSITELAVLKSLSSINCKSSLFISTKTKCILKQLHNSGLLSDDLLFSAKASSSARIYTVDLRNKIANLRKEHELIRYTRPDFISFNVDFDFYDYKLITQYTSAFWGRSPDAIIKSRWFSIGNGRICYADTLTKNHDNEYNNYPILDADDISLFKLVEKKLRANITFPRGIKKL